MKIELKVKGMHCVGCENSVREAILGQNGVKDAKVDYARESASVEFDERKTDANKIVRAVKSAGFEAEKRS
jgi:uncharacterized protein